MLVSQQIASAGDNPALEPIKLCAQYEGIAQVAPVPNFSTTARPRHVFCGDKVPCPVPTDKTLNLRPVRLAQAPALRTVIELPAPAPVTEPPKPEPHKTEAKRLDVHFSFGRHALAKGEKQSLDAFAKEVRDLKGIVKVDGFTDAVGTKNFNDRLAAKRAGAVQKHLISAGIPAERIQVGSTGKCCYVGPNDTKAGRAANRRAEVVSSLSVTFEKE